MAAAGGAKGGVEMGQRFATSPSSVSDTEHVLSPAGGGGVGGGGGLHSHESFDEPEMRVRDVLSAFLCMAVLLAAAAIMDQKWEAPVKPTFNRFDNFITCPAPSPPVETVPPSMLTGVWVILPIALIFVIDSAFTAQRICVGSIAANQRLASVLGVMYRLCVIIAGGAIQVGITAVAKSAVAEYRPDFLAQCNLNTTGLPASQAWVPVTRCMGAERWIADGRRAFFSGHASSSFFYMVYFSLFVYQMFQTTRWGRRQLWPLVLQSVAIASAAYCASTRVADCRHHLHDVIIGGVFGSIAAVLVYYVVYGQLDRGAAGIRRRMDDGQVLVKNPAIV